MLYYLKTLLSNSSKVHRQVVSVDMEERKKGSPRFAGTRLSRCETLPQTERSSLVSREHVARQTSSGLGAGITANLDYLVLVANATSPYPQGSHRTPAAISGMVGMRPLAPGGSPLLMTFKSATCEPPRLRHQTPLIR